MGCWWQRGALVMQASSNIFGLIHRLERYGSVGKVMLIGHRVGNKGHVE